MSEDHVDLPALSGLVPGAFVRHKSESHWGLGQIQSVQQDRITVNFEHRGKVVVRGGHQLVPASPETP